MKLRLPVALAAAALTILHCTTAEGDSGCRYLWLVRNDLSTPESIDQLLQVAQDAGANGVIAQVVGRGEAFYYSDILPLADFDGDFDPLGYLVTRAGPLGLEVHAWVNAFLVWSSAAPPSDSGHVCLSHPEWFMADAAGRSTLSYSREECEAAGLVGATLSPAESGVREMLADVAEEISTFYGVDGIHLDYIRYPNESFGFEGLARARFFFGTGTDPVDFLVGFRSPPEDVLAMWRDWREDQVTASVRTVRSRLDACAPDVMLTCAVMADPADAESQYSQGWRDWLEDGDVDLVMTMAYTTSADRALRLARSGTAVNAWKVVHGIGVYNQPLSSALTGAREAMSGGAAGVCVFSLNTLEHEDAFRLDGFWNPAGITAVRHAPNPALFYRTGCGTVR
jgi:uncharacterized lipoprotein YddW (UPF0748 family)